jgi:hypothetical protein
VAEPPRGTLPEITSAGATGLTARLYADIRSVTGAPMVNLVFRHLATDVARLSRVWGALRPAFVDGRIERATETLPPPLPPLPAAEVRAALDRRDVPATAREALAATLDAYGRANRSNLVAFSALLGRRPEDRPSGGAPAGSDWPLPAWPTALPPMAPLETTTDHVSRLLYRLGRADPGSPDAFIPSLYRHLVSWPALLETLVELTEPCYDRGEIRRGASRLRMAADAAAPGVDEDGTIAAAMPTEVAPVVETFCGRIAEMLVIGRLLEGAAATPTSYPRASAHPTTGDGPQRLEGEDRR